MFIIQAFAVNFSAINPTIISPLPRSETPLAKGVDVSKWNCTGGHTIDWGQVRDAGYTFAIVRAGFGKDDWGKQTDPRFDAHVTGAKAAGLHVGAYHYSYAVTVEDAKREVAFLIHNLRKFPKMTWTYPIFIDFEDKCQKDLSKETCTEIVEVFMKELRANGYLPGFYSFLSWTRDKLDTDRLMKTGELWVAHWAQNCGSNHAYGIWQYTSDGYVPGIKGRVDLNFAYKDYPALVQKLRLNGHLNAC